MLTLITPLSNANDLELGIFQLNRGEFKAAIAEFEPLVAEKYSPAQYQMAQVYLYGYGVPKNPKKAVELLTLAANQNYPDAMFDLALMYTEGKHVAKDVNKAFILTEKAANKGLASAQFNTGVMYYTGSGVQRNHLKASRWYEKAAKQNYALAQFNLALMYFNGEGVDKDIKMSYVWNILAARNNYIQAEKSRDMDEHKLSVDDIKSGRETADRIYENINRQLKKAAKEAEEIRKRNTY